MTPHPDKNGSPVDPLPFFSFGVKRVPVALQMRVKREAVVPSKRLPVAQEMRDKGEPTVPGLLQDELVTNPFLRPNDPAIRAKLGIPADSDNATAFGAIRKAKDNF